MRRIAILVALFGLGAAPPAANPGASVPKPAAKLISPAPHCADLQVARSMDGPLFRRLGELPPADAYQAVYRLGADGCIDPLLVSDRIRPRPNK